MAKVGLPLGSTGITNDILATKIKTNLDTLGKTKLKLKDDKCVVKITS